MTRAFTFPGLPTRVMGQLMGLPEEDWELLHTLAERQTAGQDPDINPPVPNCPAEGLRLWQWLQLPKPVMLLTLK